MPCPMDTRRASTFPSGSTARRIRSINWGRAMSTAPVATATRAPTPARVAMRASGMPAITVDAGRSSSSRPNGEQQHQRERIEDALDDE